MTLFFLLSSLFSHPITYDPCELDWGKVDSIEIAALNGDSVAVKKMGCIATTTYYEGAERLFWLFRWIDQNPCAAGYYYRLFKSWKFEVHLIEAALRDPRASLCKRDLGYVMERMCQSDSAKNYSPCDSFRNIKRKPLIAKPQPDSR